MANARKPGPVCQMEHPVWVGDGTMCVAPSPAPGPVGTSTLVAGAAAPLPRVLQSITISIAGGTTWDVAVRELYRQGAEAVRAQALESVRIGGMTAEQAKLWAVGQRNALIKAARDQSSPIGRFIAECIKPTSKLRSAGDLQKLGKTAEGIIESSAKTNPWVNRVTFAVRYLGPVLLVLEVSFSAYHVANAPENERWSMAAQEAGSWTGALTFGWAGGAAGCEALGAVGSLVPVAGNAVGCAVGGVIGMVGGAALGGWAGGQAGDFVYRSLDGSQATIAKAGRIR